MDRAWFETIVCFVIVVCGFQLTFEAFFLFAIVTVARFNFDRMFVGFADFGVAFEWVVDRRVRGDGGVDRASSEVGYGGVV